MADDLRVNAVIALGIDPEKARQIVAATDATAKGLQTAQKQADELKKKFAEIAQAGEKMRFVGTAIAASGAGILAPFILSAQQYATTYKTLEKTSADYLNAQKRQADATTALGRVSASVLIPVMNQVADLEQKIADFATAHPELVKIAVGAGTALVAGGGALIAAGTAVSTLAKSAELLQKFTGGGAGNASGAIGKAIGAVALMGAAAEGTVLAINLYGKAVGDTRAEHYQLTDTLKTARQILVIFAEKLLDGAKLAAQFGAGLGDFVATLQMKFIQLIENLNNSIRDILHLNGSTLSEDDRKAGALGVISNARDAEKAGQITPDQLKDVIHTAQQFADNQNATEGDLKNLLRQLDFTKIYKSFDDAAVRVASKFDSAIGHLQQGIAQGAQDFADNGTIPGLSGSGSSTPPLSPLVSPEGVQAYIEFSQKLKDLDKTGKQDLLDLKKNYDAAEKKAETEKQTQIDKINSDYMANSLKETQDFLESEQKEQKASNKERIRLLQDLNDTLFSAAASNDVVAFLNAQRQGKKDLDRQKEDASDADKQRIADFQKQQATDAKNRQTALNDLNKQFKEQDAARKSDYNNQRNALISKQNAERQLTQQDFAMKLAGLAGNIAGLSSIQQAGYAQAETAFQKYLDANQSALQQRIRDAYGIAANAGGTANLPTNSSTTTDRSRDRGAGIPHLATGGDITRDGLFHLHRGEKVLNAQRSNGGGPNISIDMRGAVLTGGATQSDLNILEGHIYKTVSKAYAAGMV